MNFDEFKKYCENAFENNILHLNYTDDKIEKLYMLTDRMLETNKVMNLTAIKDEKSIIIKHYIDSLFVSQYIEKGKKIIDIGCGAGFPTLPLAIFRDDLTIVAVDSTAKKIGYINDTVNYLKLDNVSTLIGRAEDIANKKEYRENFDYAVARAVASLPILTELCMPFVKANGNFIAMKAQKADEELLISKNAISKCGGQLNNITNHNLTNFDGSIETRNIIVISKNTQTPKEFPRHYSKINKNPL